MEQIKKFLTIINEVERMAYHKDMPIRVRRSKDFMSILRSLPEDKIEHVVDTIADIVDYYSFKTEQVSGRMKASGHGGKGTRKNFTQQDNFVYHAHLGNENKVSKKGERISNDMVEFQVFEVPLEESNPDDKVLVINFFNITKHGRGNYSSDYTPVHEIEEYDDLNKHTDRMKGF